MSTVEDLDYGLCEAAVATIERDLVGHVIDGETRESRDGGTMPVHDPSSGRQVALAAAAGSDDVAAAVEAARRAFDDFRWRGLPPMERESRLRRLAALLRDNVDELSDLDVLDAGLLRRYSGFIVEFGAQATEYYAGWPSKLSGSIPSVPDEFSVYLQREPIGVVAMIMPWNGPSAIAAFIAGAIAAGNSLVLKPAEQAPLTCTRIGELCLEAGIPPGVVNVLQGDGQVAGAGLVEHPMVDKVMFTGSVETGVKIAQAAAKTVKRVTLELGGKSPFIIFDDADVDAAAEGAMGAIWGNAGQVCTAGSRTLVHRSVHDRYLEAVTDATSGLRVGSAFAEDTDMGPLITQDQLDRVRAYVDVGIDEGAELVLRGGAPDRDGYYHEPVVFGGVDNNMRIAQEEIFGPVMAVVPFNDEEEAYRLANEVPFGLAAGVWTRDIGRAHRAARALRAGTVWVNCYQATDPAVPYGGFKHSGYGKSLGAESLDAFTQTKAVWMAVD